MRESMRELHAKRPAMREEVFALYKGDCFIAIGTAEELARLQGVTAETIRYYSTPAHRRCAENTNRFLAVRITNQKGSK